MIYLDYAATNPIRPEVVQLISQSLVLDFGNPSSIYQIGKKNKIKLLEARQKMATLLGVKAQDLYFTSGATEANNWALLVQAKVSKSQAKGNHIVATAIEHPSVSEVLAHLEDHGFQVTYIYPDQEGEFSGQAFLDASHDQTIGWVAMAANNETGHLLDIEDIGKLAQANGYWFHVDAVQLVGHGPLESVARYATSCVGSAHKFGGPKGIGFLVYQAQSNEDYLKPLLYGGGQESNKRSGTENLPYILGMTKALELSYQEISNQTALLQSFRNQIIESLNQAKIDFEVNGHPNRNLPHILNIWLKNRKASQILIKLDLKDICISAGSACSAGSVTASPVLKAFYPNQPQRWEESIRISMGYQTSQTDVNVFIENLIEILERKS